MGGANKTYCGQNYFGRRVRLKGRYYLEKTLGTTGHADHLFAFGSDISGKRLFKGFQSWSRTRPIIGKDLSDCREFVRPQRGLKHADHAQVSILLLIQFAIVSSTVQIPSPTSSCARAGDRNWLS